MVQTRLDTVEPLTNKTPDRHTVVAAQPKVVIETLTCTCSRAKCARQKAKRRLLLQLAHLA